MIELHPKAIEIFDNEANKLLLLLKPYKIRPSDSKLSGSRAAEFAKELPIDKVHKHSIDGFYDGFGNRLARYFDFNGSPVGFDGNDYILFREFVENVFRKKEINNSLSKKCIEKLSFILFEKKYKGEIDNNLSFSEFLINETEKLIKQLKVSVPISYLSIENSFQLGDITYEYYDENFFDKLFVELNKKENGSITENSFEKLRKDYQGVVFASKIIIAEKERAIEKIIEEVDEQIKLIRCFSPTTFLPIVDSYFDRKGHTLIPHNHCFVFEGELPIINTFRDKSIDYYFPFSNNLLKDYNDTGFIQIFDLINKEPKSDLEELLLNVAFLFSRCIESKFYQDKLVYALVSLETLLLKNTSEPIQNSVGLRLSFLTRKEIEKRKEVIELIKQSYILRSSYIHHGKKKENIELLQKLQHLVWQTIINTLKSLDKFKTQEDFLNYIEDLILS